MTPNERRLQLKNLNRQWEDLQDNDYLEESVEIAELINELNRLMVERKIKLAKLAKPTLINMVREVGTLVYSSSPPTRWSKHDLVDYLAEILEYRESTP